MTGTEDGTYFVRNPEDQSWMEASKADFDVSIASTPKTNPDDDSVHDLIGLRESDGKYFVTSSMGEESEIPKGFYDRVKTQ